MSGQPSVEDGGFAVVKGGRHLYKNGMLDRPENEETKPHADAALGQCGGAVAVAGRSEAAFDVVGGDASSGLVLVCDHARNFIPPELNSLGLPERELQRHIAYDIGVEAVTRAMAKTLGVPAVLSRFSRLLIDPNRGVDDPTLVMKLSDGAVIPGNRNADVAEVQRRIDQFHAPYHTAIRDVLTTYRTSGIVPVLLSLHSFTPSWKGVPRPWDVTVLWDRDARFVAPLLEQLVQIPNICVGENEPYTGELVGDCMNTHGTRNGYAHALVEVRQDLIADPDGQALWAERLANAASQVLARDDLRPELTTILDFATNRET